MASKPSEKFAPPPWVAKPKLENCGLKVMKEGKRIQTITEIAQKPYVLFGRNASMSDIKLEHPSISRRHALIGHGSSGNIYVMDLGSSHGTFVNSQRLKKKKREPLRDGYTVKFGASTREYIVKLDLDIDDDSITKTQPNPKKRKLEKTANDIESEQNGAKRAKIEKVSCRHLLVKHKDSRRPKSWKSDSGITRSKQDAIELILKFRKEILGETVDENENENENGSKDTNGNESDKDKKEDKLKAKFKELASKESDCNSYKRGGDLGSFGKGRMQKPFEIAAFALSIGQLSEPVQTDSGVHLILRYA
eukprot:CAMPEP_0201571450 /NCGR_PEP_ID=MMETSP0190_2-20130828/14216_1 /ASSEMBLY_ACC=CAM_ASM_000263 /TAXON_ID=37353 /ORGANISM="Rosalina sp." /LENGTH=306 /DNA_ID=CAMNT_0047996097 /DNA_START=22 /DNA_END=942 /DNA_ORIENTATION=-